MIKSHLTFPHPLSLMPLITKYVDDPCIKLFILSRSGQQPGRQLHLVFAKDHLSCSIIYLLTSSCNSNKWSTTIDKGIIILSSQLQPSFSLRTIFLKVTELKDNLYNEVDLLHLGMVLLFVM